MTTGAAVWWALVLVELVAFILAAALARLQRLPLAVTLAALVAFALVDELVVEAVHRALAGQPRPFTGTDRALYHIETALVLGWPAVLAASSWRAFSFPRWDVVAKRRLPDPGRLAPLLLAGAWLGFLLALVRLHPLDRATTARLLHVFEAGCVVAALAPIPLAWRRPWHVPQVGVGLLVAVELAVATIGPWVLDVYRDWEVASAGYLVGFGALSAYLLASNLRGPARRSTAAR